MANLLYAREQTNISTEEAGRIAGVSRRKIIHWCKHFGLPSTINEHGRRRIVPPELAEWLKTSRPQPKQRRPGNLNQFDDTKGGVIYALIDPRPEKRGQIRYIGKTFNPRKRRGDYLRCKAHGVVQKWLLKLRRLGHKPIFRIVDECLFGLCSLEQEWIAKGRAKGWPLLNVTPGGEGGEWDERSRKSQSEFNKKKWKDPAYQANWRASQQRQLEAIETAAARRRGLTLESYRLLKREREAGSEERRQQWLANMAKAAERAKRPKRTSRMMVGLDADRSIFVPLTHDSSAFIPLTCGKFAVIDADDWERASKHWWSAQHKGGYWRAKTNGPKHDGTTKLILLNRFIMRAGPSDCIRHRNGKQLDCRKRNLVAGWGKFAMTRTPTDRDRLHQLDMRLTTNPCDASTLREREELVSNILAAKAI